MTRDEAVSLLLPHLRRLIVPIGHKRDGNTRYLRAWVTRRSQNLMLPLGNANKVVEEFVPVLGRVEEWVRAFVTVEAQANGAGDGLRSKPADVLLEAVQQLTKDVPALSGYKALSNGLHFMKDGQQVLVSGERVFVRDGPNTGWRMLEFPIIAQQGSVGSFRPVSSASTTHWRRPSPRYTAELLTRGRRTRWRAWQAPWCAF